MEHLWKGIAIAGIWIGVGIIARYKRGVALEVTAIMASTATIVVAFAN